MRTMRTFFAVAVCLSGCSSASGGFVALDDAAVGHDAGEGPHMAVPVVGDGAAPSRDAGVDHAASSPDAYAIEAASTSADAGHDVVAVEDAAHDAGRDACAPDAAALNALCSGHTAGAVVDGCGGVYICTPPATSSGCTWASQSSTEPTACEQGASVICPSALTLPGACAPLGWPASAGYYSCCPYTPGFEVLQVDGGLEALEE
jgi:hypothetical protein